MAFDQVDAVKAKSAYARAYFDRHWDSLSRAPRTRLRAVDELSGLPHHAHSIGVGRKLVFGKVTSEECIRFYVPRKLPKTMLRAELAIPREIDGIPTDVIESAIAHLAVACTYQRRTARRPLQGGISAANNSNLAGTLGAFCRSTRQGEEDLVFALSNYHVLAGSSTAMSDVLQPSAVDGGTNDDRIGSFGRGQAVQQGAQSSNLCDAAIAVLASGLNIDPSICTLGAISGVSNPVKDSIVHKHGRTSGYTTGIIDDVSIDAVVDLSRDDKSQIARFVNQVRVRPRTSNAVFSQGGDSGSLILTKSDNTAVALLFACPDDGSFAYANPLTAVLGSLEVQLITTL